MTSKPTGPSTPIIAVALLALLPGAVGAQPQEIDIDLSLRAEIHRAHFLRPAAPVVTEQLVLDSAESVRWVFGSPSKTLDIVLTAPDGATISLTDPDSGLAKVRVFPDPSDPTTTGANYLFALTDPLPGTWTYRIEETGPLSGPRAVLLNLFSSSPVRVGLLGGEEDYRVDRPVSLALVASEGPTLLTSLNVAASIRGIEGNPFPETALSFTDDGSDPDVNPGDGLFTAGFDPGVPGRYQVVTEASGVRSNGDTFQRTATAQFEIRPVQATLTGFFSDRGIDLNGDALLDRIGVSPGIDVLSAGEYNVLVTLESTGGGRLTANLLSELPAGVVSPEVSFSAEDVKQLLAADGPFEVAEVRIEATAPGEAQTVDAAFNLGPTAAYSLADLQRRAIEFAGNGSATGLDLDGNGKFDFLDVTLDVDLLIPGFYRWSARLVGSNSAELALAGGSGFFGVGNGTLLLRFDGRSVGESGLDGPYFVRNLIVFGAGESLIEDDPFTTQAFLASEFEGFVEDQEPPQLTVAATPAELWPPNHELIQIDVEVQVTDNLDPDPVVTLEAITSNEGDNLLGDGNTTDDIQVGPNGEIFLRAERSGTGTGRIYTLTYSARDDAGNTAQASTEVRVPLSQRPR